MQSPRRQDASLFPSPFASFASSRFIFSWILRSCRRASNTDYREGAKDAKKKGGFAALLASWRLGGSIVFLAIIGCAAHSQQQPLPSPPSQVISGDSAPPAEQMPIHAEMYQLEMPFGANSRDDSFWKLVDEDVLDVPTAQNLIRNGFRVGRARIADWPAFLKVLIGESAIKRSEANMMAQPSVDDGTIRMSDVLPEELLFIYDNHGLTMRSFNDCRNMLSLAFEWAPRKQRTIRLTFCPMVQAMQTRMDYSLSDNPRPTQYLHRENFYDLHLTADIAPGEFLIVGTSTATADPNRIASRFLTRDGPNRRFEQVLLFVGDPGLMENMRFRRPRPTTR
jgi:hypothetical protein